MLIFLCSWRWILERYTSWGRLMKRTDVITVQCPTCGSDISLQRRSFYNRKSKGMKYCSQCVGEAISNRVSKNMKELWKDSAYRKRMSIKSDKAIEASRSQLNNLTDEQRELGRNKSISTLRSVFCRNKQRSISLNNVTDEFKQKISIKIKEAYKDPIKSAKMRLRNPMSEEMKRKSSERMKELWQTKNYKEKWFKGMEVVSNNHNWISTYQKILYDILEDLKLDFYREPDDIRKLSFGCYRCDAIVCTPRPCIIEVNGDYFHRLVPSRVDKDKKFLNYYDNNLKDKYDLLILWEHEFLAKNRIRDILINKLGLKRDITWVDKDHLTVNSITKEEGDKFLKKYHYMSKIGRGSIYNALLFNNKIIGVSCISSITRKETADRLELQPHQVMELCKFCLHPGYKSHNLASWFLSRSINIGRPEVKVIISFSDLAFGHTGTIYKAAGWRFDGKIPPTYWYIDKDGHIMHKKTLYNHARSIRMKESDFANKFEYNKIYTGHRNRYIKVING